MAAQWTNIIGRKREQSLLKQMLDSPEAELLAIYGRRRVGKTHLIREFFEPRVDLYMAVTGVKDAPISTQLWSFKSEMERVFYGGAPLPLLRSWEEAFRLLCDAISDRISRQPGCQIVVFLDELPWLATPRSRLMQSLDHIWNTRLVRFPRLRFVVCGSAASWILDNLVHAKGGLYNRITRRIRLEPFSLSEARDFLASRGLALSQEQVIEIYMAVGGVPHYLKQMERGRSAAQIIAWACFDPSGVLADEFEHLFASLFVESEMHEAIVRAIASRRSGVTRNEIIEHSGISSGGRLRSRLRELEEAGFIASLAPYQARTKNTLYRLIDEYSWFYLKWIERAPKGVLARGRADYWVSKSQTPGFRSWAGYAFEALCLRHAHLIQGALGIRGIPAEVATWRYTPSRRQGGQRGAQVDLLFDRADGVINLCELKYCQEPFAISRSYARELKETIAIFERQTRTKKQIQLTLVAPFGLKRNAWSEDLVDSVVTADALLVEC